MAALVVENVGPISWQSPAETLRLASERVGFEVRAPGYLPGADLNLAGIAVHTGRPTGFAIAKVIYTPGGATRAPSAGLVPVEVEVAQVPLRLAAPANDDFSRPLPIGGPGMDVYVTGEEPQLIYTVQLTDRTYFITITGPTPTSIDEVARLIASLR